MKKLCIIAIIVSSIIAVIMAIIGVQTILDTEARKTFGIPLFIAELIIFIAAISIIIIAVIKLKKL